MNAKALIPLLAGLGIGGLALVLGINTLKSARAGQPTAAKVRIWAAKEDIPRGMELKEEMLQEVSYPADLLPKGAFKKKEELVGRVPRLVAPAGLPILETMLSPPGTKPGIFVKAGYRAVAVKIDAGSGVDFHLEPGSFVDVVGSFKINRNGRAETIARTIVENAEVAAVGPRVSPPSGTEAGLGAAGKEKDRTQAIRAVTLFVKPEDVPKLLLTEQQGRIKLSMRGDQDEVAFATEHWASDAELTGESPPAKPEAEPAPAASSPLDWLQGLFGKPAAPPPVAVAAAPVKPHPALPLERWILRIYRGDKAEIVQFKSADSCERIDAAFDAAAPVPALSPKPAAAENQEDHQSPAEPQEPSE
jgi:Flp pilus assembly protein CpaB